MKLRSLHLEQFKKFNEPVGIDGFSDGLNLIAGPNEMGKSTLFLALRAALFERHAAKSQMIKALQPHHIQGAAPGVSIAFEMDDGVYHLEKRFLRRTLARLTGPGGQVAEGHDAEAALQTLLHLEGETALSLEKGSPGHFGVILTPQSQSFHQPSLTASTRHALEETIAAEVEQLVNQSEVDAILTEVETVASELVDKRGKPKGRYREMDERRRDLEEEIVRLEQDRQALAEDIEALALAKAALREQEAGEAPDGLRRTLDDLEHRRALMIKRRDIEANVTAARYRVEHLTASRAWREKLTTEQTALRATLDEQARTHQDLLAEIDGLETARQDQETSRQSLTEREADQQARQRAVEQLNQALSQQAELDRALLAVATEVRLDIDPTALDRVRLDEQPLARTTDIRQVTDGLTIEIEALGQIRVLPKSDQLEQLRDHRASLQRAIDDQQERLELQDAEPEAIEACWQEIGEEAATLAAERAELDDFLQETVALIQARKASLAGESSKHQQIETRLDVIAKELAEKSGVETSGDDAGLALQEAEATLAEAEAALLAAHGDGGKDADTLSLDQLEAEIKTLRSTIDQATQAVHDAKLAIGRLTARISVRHERGLDENLDERQRRLSVLDEELARYQRDAGALGLLKTTLREAAESAKQEFQAPLAAKLTPYIKALLPEADIDVSPSFGVAALDRGQPVVERYEQLSDGTREQIAILTRLAYARMLQEEGRPVFLVLDDALVFSDEQRLRRMFAILEEAAETMQIIVLTCRDDRFRDLKAKRLRIEPRPEAGGA